MIKPILAEFWGVDDRALRRPSTQTRWAREMAVTPLHRESSGDVPGFSPPSRLWTVLVHVVDQRVDCTHTHHPHRLRSHLLHCNRDHGDFIVCVSIPDTSIDGSSRSMEEGPARDYFYCSLQKGALTDSRDVEPKSPAAPLSPISTNDSARGRTGSTI